MAQSRADKNRKDLERRNALAREYGFTSRAAMRRAQEHGLFPSALEREVNTEFAVRKIWEGEQRRRTPEFQRKIDRSKVVRLPEQPKRKPVQFTEAPKGAPRTERSYRDEKSFQWSKKHSRKERSQYYDDWDEDRKQAYYDAYVDGFDIPHDERDYGPMYDYLVEYWDFDPDPDSVDWAAYDMR